MNKIPSKPDSDSLALEEERKNLEPVVETNDEVEGEMKFNVIIGFRLPRVRVARGNRKAASMVLVLLGVLMALWLYLKVGDIEIFEVALKLLIQSLFL